MKLNPINLEEAARYMGVRGTAEGQTLALLERADALVRKRINPKYTYRVSEVRTSEEGVRIGEVSRPFGGNDLKKHLTGCTRAVILAATLTSEADKLIRQAQVESTAFALAVDCVCSAAIEQVCDRAEEEIFGRLDVPYRTWRFSPGYGDLPIDTQKDVLLHLNASRLIGLTVSESCMLIPSKSVTAVIGISEAPLNKGARGCAICSMRESCAYSHGGGCKNEQNSI